MTGCGCDDELAGLERRTLWILLVINAIMFASEAVFGWLAESTALLADSLDMGADAAVYGVALYAVGRSRSLQAGAATTSGVLQIALGLGVLIEVARRSVYGSEPISLLIIVTGLVALLANVICLALIAKHRDGGMHMRASWIFSKNDVIANVGVVISGGLVMLFGSRVPDLVVGSVVALIVLRGGVRIVREATASSP
jgi:Co/Zn/Cd efflux system component